MTGFSHTDLIEKELVEVPENPTKIGIPLKGFLVISTDKITNLFKCALSCDFLMKLMLQ